MSSKRSCWDCYWLLRTQSLADRSTCITRSVGAVAVRNKHAIAEGFNGTLPGRQHCDAGGCDRCHQSKPAGLETCGCCHAEANLVAYAARIGTSLEGSVLYCTTQPCLGCTKLLVSAGLAAVIFDELYPAASVLQASLTADAALGDPNGVAFSRFRCTCS